jgi:two-component system, chemotaxis family, chemotaxis protein CheY
MVKQKQFPDVRVLLVERNSQNTSLYQFALEDMGFGQIMFAMNTEEAMDQMYFNGPSLIILGDGLYPKSLTEFMADIRQGNAGVAKDVPVVAIAARGTKQAIECARDSGVTEIVSLPLSANSLRLRVRAALKASREFIDKVAYQGPDRRRRTQTSDNDRREHGHTKGPLDA